MFQISNTAPPIWENENSSNEESMPDQCRDQLPHQQVDNQNMLMSPFQSHNSSNRNSNFQIKNATQYLISNQKVDSQNVSRFLNLPYVTSPSASRGKSQQIVDHKYGHQDQFELDSALDERTQPRRMSYDDQHSHSDRQISYFDNDNSHGFYQQEDIECGQNERQQQQQRQQMQADSSEKIQQQQKKKKKTQKQDTRNKQKNQQIRQKSQQKKKGAAAEKKYQKQQNNPQQTIVKTIRKKQQNKEQPNKVNKNKRHPDKHTFLIDRDSEARKIEKFQLTSFPYEDEFRNCFRTFIYEGEEINFVTLPQIFHRIKQGMDNKIKEQGFQTKVGQNGFYMLQISMLIAKLFLYQKYFPYRKFLKLISEDLIRKFNDSEISSAIRELYLILNGYCQQKYIDWNYLVTNTRKLHYQFEVSRFHQKSSCVNYRQFIDDKAAYKVQDTDDYWYDFGCNGDKPGRDEFRNALQRGLLEDFQINHFMKYFLANTQRNDKKKWDIYLDDILNLIAGSLLE